MRKSSGIIAQAERQPTCHARQGTFVLEAAHTPSRAQLDTMLTLLRRRAPVAHRGCIRHLPGGATLVPPLAVLADTQATQQRRVFRAAQAGETSGFDLYVLRVWSCFDLHQFSSHFQRFHSVDS